MNKAEEILDKHLENRSWTKTVPKYGNLYNTLLDAVSEALTIPVVISRLKERLEINAGRLCEPLLKENKNPKDDPDCHKAFLMLAHLAEIEDYLNGL